MTHLTKPRPMVPIPSSRRHFLSTSAKLAIASVMATPTLQWLSGCSPKLAPATSGIPPIGMEQRPLAYAYSALEPWIDTQTMDIHYNKHAAAYSKNLREALGEEKVAAGTSLEAVLSKISSYSPKMRNNGGGHYNHELFWMCLTPNQQQQPPQGKLLSAIQEQFSSLEAMQKQFNDAAKARFGSGWTWLIQQTDGKLAITSTPNQDNPLMDVADKKGTPLFGLDVWEHAYYLKYQNRRADYIDSFWKILNWSYVSTRFQTA